MFSYFFLDNKTLEKTIKKEKSAVYNMQTAPNQGHQNLQSKYHFRCSVLRTIEQTHST